MYDRGMSYKIFKSENLKELWQPEKGASKLQGGQVTIVGGSDIFHGAPIFALVAASRIVDIVFFSSPKMVGEVVATMKGMLSSFLWMPFDDVETYIEKSDAALIGPGLMRYRNDKGIHSSDVCDAAGMATKKLTEGLFEKFPDKKWVVDAGSLQVISPSVLPRGAVITPNRKEFRMLFGVELSEDMEEVTEMVEKNAKEYEITIMLKGPTTVVSNGIETWWVEGGSRGLIKGGTGDALAGLTVALLAKNSAVMSAAAANFLLKKASEELEEERGLMFNADDVTEQIPKTWGRFMK